MLNNINYVKEADLQNSVIFFGALSWCAPCKMIHPVVEEFSEKYENMNFYYIDADENSFELRDNSISSVPTLVFFVDGEEKERIIGARPKKDIEALILKYRTVD